MTNIERLELRLPGVSTLELEDVLQSAESVILSRCFVSVARASEDERKAALDEHNEKLLDVAVIIYNMRGIEGQTSHSENGVARQYADYAGMKPILEQIIPRGYVI